MLSFMFKLKGRVWRQNESSLGTVHGPSAAWSGAVAAVSGDLRVSTGEGGAGTVCTAGRHPRPVPAMSTLTVQERVERVGAAAEEVPSQSPPDRTAVTDTSSPTATDHQVTHPQQVTF